jgi:hypothetical protein
MTVSGKTMIRVERHSDHNRDNQTPQTSVGWFEDRSLCELGSLEHGQLMAQCNIFSLQCRLATKASDKRTKQHIRSNIAEAAYLRPATNPTIQMPMRFSGTTNEEASCASVRRKRAHFGLCLNERYDKPNSVEEFGTES